MQETHGTSAKRLAGRALTYLTAMLVLASCSGTATEPTPSVLAWEDRSVAELAAILADPIAAMDCELKVGAEQICNRYSTNAAEALREKGDPAAVPALVAAVKDDDTYYQAVDASWEGLEKIGGPEVIAFLVASITEKGSATRANRAADILGRLGGVEHNQILVEALYTTSACQSDGYSDALVAINRADATPLLRYLESFDTVAVFGPLIRIGQPGTEEALLAAFEEFAGKDMAQCYLNSGNSKLEMAAERWVNAHGYWTLRIPGGSTTWGSG